MRYAKRLCILALGLLLGCHDDAPKLSRGQFCTQGGAMLNTTTNDCQCPPTQKWTGSRCEAMPVAAATPERAPPLVPEVQSTPAPEVAPVVAATAVPGLSAAESEALRQNCAAAKADWLEAAQFCQCPGGKVLLGKRCVKMRGLVTKDACSLAIKAGRWHKGDCECPGTETYVPQRGGCVEPARGQSEVQKLSCESSLDLGHWDDTRKRCECPRGRIWADELCFIQTRLSSALICESDYHQGKWDWDKKRCDCPQGELWINQSCLDPHSLPQSKVCESEWNSGHWDAAAQACRCPRGQHWESGTFVCQA